MRSIESVILEAVTTDRPQVVLSAGDALDVFDACLERVLQQQLRLDAEGVVRSWLRTQLFVPVRMPKSRSPIGVFYKQKRQKAGDEWRIYFLCLSIYLWIVSLLPESAEERAERFSYAIEMANA